MNESRSFVVFSTPLRLLPAELIYGAMRVADSPLPRHQEAVAQLFRVLDAHVRERELGQMWLAPLDVILDYHKALIVQPDLFFVSNDRADIIRDRVRGAPDLVVEVLSPNPRIGSTEERVQWFAEYFVRECWLFQQDRREIVHGSSSCVLRVLRAFVVACVSGRPEGLRYDCRIARLKLRATRRRRG